MPRGCARASARMPPSLPGSPRPWAGPFRGVYRTLKRSGPRRGGRVAVPAKLFATSGSGSPWAGSVASHSRNSSSHMIRMASGTFTSLAAAVFLGFCRLSSAFASVRRRFSAKASSRFSLRETASRYFSEVVGHSPRLLRSPPWPFSPRPTRSTVTPLATFAFVSPPRRWMRSMIAWRVFFSLAPNHSHTPVITTFSPWRHLGLPSRSKESTSPVPPVLCASLRTETSPW
mmetsp:Transcript_25161/g.75543  ORF Transcript_25161/g.75543 Transcript_25161/m.75543 type:complete len:230 (-) Transcript_25161:241-930(-)